MKKLILGLLAAALMSLGLVGGVADSAHAGPYTGTVSTKVVVSKVTSPIRRNRAPLANVVVRATSGNVQPSANRGTVRMVCSKGAVKKFGRTAVLRNNHRLTGPTLTKKGTWNCTVRYDGRASIFRDSISPLFSVRVR